MTQRRKTIRLQAGSHVQVRTGSRMVLATVAGLGARGRELHLELAEPATGELVVRWLDENGDAWRTTGQARLEQGLTKVQLDEDWVADAMRASQRITGERHSMRGEMQAGSLPPGSRFDLVCLDVSASGCRASGVGRQPKVGDLVKLALVHPYDDGRWILARVMRMTALAFGRFEVGFRFEPADSGERVWLTGWRDAWAFVSTDVEDEADTPPAAAADDDAEEAA